MNDKDLIYRAINETHRKEQIARAQGNTIDAAYEICERFKLRAVLFGILFPENQEVKQ